MRVTELVLVFSHPRTLPSQVAHALFPDLLHPAAEVLPVVPFPLTTLCNTHALVQDIIYTETSMEYCGHWCTLHRSTQYGTGQFLTYFHDVVVRDATSDAMEKLFDKLSAKNGVTTECYNANSDDYGFTYRCALLINPA